MHAICLHFIQELELTFPRKEYIFHPQYTVAHNKKRGPNPRADMCIVASGEIPRVLYECKTNVGHNVMQLDGKDIIEVLLQGYYCLRTYSVPKMLICLTDLFKWHYLLIESSKSKKMILKGYHKIDFLQLENKPSVSLPLSSLQKHTNFLIEMER